MNELAGLHDTASEPAPAARPWPHAAFLCHAHKDQDFVVAVHRLLKREHNVDAWLDQKQLVPGDPWLGQVEEVTECRRVGLGRT
jgi:hypothetical protein